MGETFWKCPSYLRLSAVTLLSLLHVSVPALLAPEGLGDFRQVEEAHAHALLQAGFQIFPAAAAEDHRERVPAEKGLPSVIALDATLPALVLQTVEPTGDPILKTWGPLFSVNKG